MDIAGLSTALSSARLNNEVGIAMLSNTMDQSEHIGANIDLSV